jgi:hypothetical protein
MLTEGKPKRSDKARAIQRPVVDWLIGSTGLMPLPRFEPAMAWLIRAKSQNFTKETWVRRWK